MLDSTSTHPIQTMRFTRYERHNAIDFNARRQAAFARKQARERERYPLFGDHIAAEQHTMDEEIARRTVKADSPGHDPARASCPMDRQRGQSAEHTSRPRVRRMRPRRRDGGHRLSLRRA